MTTKKLLITGIIASCSIEHSAQVGVNNAKPLQALHVSGSGTGNRQPIIRIEGLNQKNNTAHENSSSTKRIYADLNGTLVVLNNNNYSKATPLPSTNIPAGAEGSVASISFTLDTSSIVHIEARVGMTVANDLSDPLSSASAQLRNGQARLFGSYFKFTSAPANIQTNTAFGNVTLSHSTNNGGAQLSGIYYFEPRKDLYLPPGSYTLVLCGYSQDGNMRFIVNSLSQPNQLMFMNISPVNY